MRRFGPHVTAIALLAAGAGCATGEAPAGDPDGAPPHIDADIADAPSAGREDADPGAPDAPPRPDAAPLPPDAMPPPPDAFVPPPPDAAPGTPDAAPPPDAMPDASTSCTTMILGLITNGDFDSGTSPWVESSSGGYPLINAAADLPIAPQSGTHAVWMGGYLSGSDQLYQSFAVPSDATELHVKGYRLIGTEETGGMWDYLYVRLRDSAGANLGGPLATYTNLDSVAAWTAFDLVAPSPYAGMTIQVYFNGTTDFSLNTNFFLDTVAVEAVVCR